MRRGHHRNQGPGQDLKIAAGKVCQGHDNCDELLPKSILAGREAASPDSVPLVLDRSPREAQTEIVCAVLAVIRVES